ncbi:uncharacterized protein LOC126892826 isoform X1 [Diabrotica virgifera virgifera]|uniref:Uncharacterized protein n=1 Tax=Diabrotica virgifera virgifera TaxID=50390 RepID=A0ABM5L7V8_DIAVI|nr:uncharacterized protein LOC126892826 isoform X1 [Diabrotica virgifera virgifera]
MKYLLKCAMFLLLIVLGDCSDEDNGYHENSDFLKNIQVTTDIGNKVRMICDDVVELEFVIWKHNNKYFYPDLSNVTNIDWVKGNNLDLTILTEEHGGKWECWNSGFPVNRYIITVNPVKGSNSTDVDTEQNDTTTKESFSMSSSTVSSNSKQIEEIIITTYWFIITIIDSVFNR